MDQLQQLLNTMDVVNAGIVAALVIGCLLGIAMIAAVTRRYFKGSDLGFGGILLTIGGIVFVGLPIWQSFELQAKTSGEVILKAKSAIIDYLDAAADNKVAAEEAEKKAADLAAQVQACADAELKAKADAVEKAAEKVKVEASKGLDTGKSVKDALDQITVFPGIKF